MSLTCNAFPTNTVGATQQTVACLGPKVVNIIDNELLPEQFLLLVIDSLNRLATLANAPAALSTIDACEVSEALRLANCSDHSLTPAFPVDIPSMQGIILAMLNEGICVG